MQDVVFVCQHGGAKSLIAAEHFSRVAAQRGLSLRGVSAGVEPYTDVPAPVVAGLLKQGIDVRRYTPQQVTTDTFAAADLVVHFGCDVGALVPNGMTLEDWADVPAVSDGFDEAHEIIVQRVEHLVDEIARRSKAPEPGRSALILSASDVKKHLNMERCIAAVEAAFHALGSGESSPPTTVGVHVPGGGFHIKAGMIDLGRKYFAVKSNGNFPANPRLNNLPTIQGVVILADATNGRMLAVVDSVELTALRTAAATAVAARYLAVPDASVAAIIGCGFQAYYQIEALRVVRPLDHVIAVDSNSARAEHFARRVTQDLQLECVTGTLSDAAAAEPRIWVTCTTSMEFILFPDHVRAGAFVAGVGVDNEHKRELAPVLLERSHVVCDLVDQCRQIGDLHHVVAAGIEPKSIHELGHIVAGRQPGRVSADDIHVFDSTGIGLQDVAACAALFEAAIKARRNDQELTVVDFAT
jgi:alanine dehydrogenase